MIRDRDLRLADLYLTMKDTVIRAGFAFEIDWQDDLRFDHVSESQFLREAAWVILSAGLATRVIQRKFKLLSDSFFHWQSAEEIAGNEMSCRTEALKIFRHLGKINAVIEVANVITRNGFELIKARTLHDQRQFIESLPYMGPATSLHLMKNVGFDVVKPDRHLLRAAEAAGCANPHQLCQNIATTVGDRLSVIDLVIWRYATIDSEYQEAFRKLKDA